VEDRFSRRSVLSGTAALLAAGPALAQKSTLTAGEVLSRMRGQIGTEWREGGVDRIIADPIRAFNLTSDKAATS